MNDRITTDASSDFEIGATVYAGDEPLGTLESIEQEGGANAFETLVVRAGETDQVFDVPIDLVDLQRSTRRDVYLTGSREELGLDVAVTTMADAHLIDVGDTIMIPRREEVLVPTTEEVEVGTVRISKRVEQVPVEQTVDAMLDDLLIERVAIDRPIASAPAPRHEGNTIIIPVVEEVLVTEKRLMLKEEIRITRRKVAQPVIIRDTVRREVVEIHDPEGTGYHAGRAPSTTAPVTSPVRGTPKPVTDITDDLPLT